MESLPNGGMGVLTDALLGAAVALGALHLLAASAPTRALGDGVAMAWAMYTLWELRPALLPYVCVEGQNAHCGRGGCWEGGGSGVGT